MKLSLIMNVCDMSEMKLDESISRIRDSYLKNDEYELVVIDDGSTKNYSEIVEKYNPVYIKTPKRGNLSSILYGIMVAKGEYIAFVSPNAQPSFNYYNTMISSATNENADVVVGEIAYNENGTVFKNKIDPITNNQIAVENEHILRFFARDLSESASVSTLYNKIFKKETLLKAKKELEKTDAVACKSFDAYGDILLCFFAVKNAKKMVNTNTGYCFFDILGESFEENQDEKDRSFSIMISALPQNDYIKEMTKNMEFCRGIFIKNNIGFCKKAYLGNNFLEIDKEISKFYKSNAPVNLVYDKKDVYTSQIIETLVRNDCKQISEVASKLIVIPKRKLSLMQKIKSKF